MTLPKFTSIFLPTQTRSFKVLSLLMLPLIGLASCTTQTFVKKDGEWVVDAPRPKAPLKIEVDNSPSMDEKVDPNEFVKDCRKEPDGRLTKFYRCLHQEHKHLLNIVKRNKSKKGSVYVNSPTNTIIITDTPKGMMKVAEALSELDVPPPQVRIRVRVVELIRSKQYEHGVEWGQDRTDVSSSILKNLRKVVSNLPPKNSLDSMKPGASAFQGTTLTFSKIGKEIGNIDVLVKLFQEMGRASVDASPDLLVAQSKTAKIYSGQEVPFITANVFNSNLINYSTKFKPTGVTLVVRPEMVDHKGVRLFVKAEVSSVTSWTDPSLVGGISNPVISKRATETTISANDGDIFVFGGLVSKRRLLVRRGLPFLGDIPVVGYLFSSTRYEMQKSYLSFLLSVEVISPFKVKKVMAKAETSQKNKKDKIKTAQLLRQKSPFGEGKDES